MLASDFSGLTDGNLGSISNKLAERAAACSRRRRQMAKVAAVALPIDQMMRSGELLPHTYVWECVKTTAVLIDAEMRRFYAAATLVKHFYGDETRLPVYPSSLARRPIIKIKVL
jgi:hypothetical protein